LLSLEANPRKSLSQNFLTSPHWADLLVTQALRPPGIEEVWEIGPGLGALTSCLLRQTSLPVRAFEYDRKLSAYLRATYPGLQLEEGDFLDADLDRMAPGRRLSVLSNLPYHLSSPIFFKLVEQRHRIAQIVLTFQREFAERLVAAPRTPAYGALTVIAQLHYQIESLGILPPGAFYPAPAVSSEALRFVPREREPESPHHVRWLVKAAFAQRRKQIVGNLKRALPAAPVEPILGELGIAPSARPEELSKDQYLQLTQAVRPYLCATICEK
jgi:16S rRNA (adenine1518-N6/adenine1519-N6)-dimethyltransferase